MNAQEHGAVWEAVSRKMYQAADKAKDEIGSMDDIGAKSVLSFLELALFARYISIAYIERAFADAHAQAPKP